MTDVFRRTVDWAIEHGITTATFHIQTPYPGTRLFARMEARRAASRLATGISTTPATSSIVRRVSRPARSRTGTTGRIVSSIAGRRSRAASLAARVAEAPGQTLLLRRGLEEVRAALGLRHPGEAAAGHDTAPRKCALQGDRGARLAPAGRRGGGRISVARCQHCGVMLPLSGLRPRPWPDPRCRDAAACSDLPMNARSIRARGFGGTKSPSKRSQIHEVHADDEHPARRVLPDPQAGRRRTSRRTSGS